MMRNERTETGAKSTRCRVCTHPRRNDYDKSIALGTMSRAEVAKEVGLHRSSVARHFTRHVEPSLAAQLATDPDLSAANIVGEIKRLYALAEEGRQAAVRKNDLNAMRGFLRDERAILELVVKLSDRADYEAEINPVEAAAESQRQGEEIRRQLDEKLDALATRRQERGAG